MNKILNKVYIKGNPNDLKILLEGCHQTVKFEDGTIKKAGLTFNEYVPVNSPEEAKEKWGVSEDRLAYYDLCFDEAEAKIEECKNDSECETFIIFETYDGIALNWVKAMAKANPKVEIRYCVLDAAKNIYEGYIFDLSTNNLEYEVKSYKTASELRYKLLNQDIRRLMKNSISTAKFSILKTSDLEEDKKDVLMNYLKDEYQFLSKKEFNDNLIILRYNELYEDKVESIEEVLDRLNEEYIEYYYQLGDANLAYEKLDSKYKELMRYSPFCCFAYSFSGDHHWSITTGIDYDEDKLDEYIKEVKYHHIYEDVENLSDMLAAIRRHVGNAMCDAGCDMHTALSMILGEDFDFGGEYVFIIDGADGEPEVEIDYL